MSALSDPATSLSVPASVVAVVGMHRSGTSCLTGSLQRCGLFLGKYNTWNHHNTQGNRENPDIVALHEQVLAANGRSWDHPPALPPHWDAGQRQTLQAILALYADAPQWGFKDPRTLLMLDHWQRVVPNLRLVGIVRHPAAVVDSLHARGAFPKDRGLFLWDHYNSLMLQAWEQQPFPILCFDHDEETFHAHLEPVQDWLGLSPLRKADRFFTPSLRNRDRFRDRYLPLPVRRLYERLLAISSQPWKTASPRAARHV